MPTIKLLTSFAASVAVCVYAMIAEAHAAYEQNFVADGPVTAGEVGGVFLIIGIGWLIGKLTDRPESITDKWRQEREREEYRERMIRNDD